MHVSQIEVYLEVYSTQLSNTNKRQFIIRLTSLYILYIYIYYTYIYYTYIYIYYTYIYNYIYTVHTTTHWRCGCIWEWGMPPNNHFRREYDSKLYIKVKGKPFKELSQILGYHIFKQNHFQNSISLSLNIQENCRNIWLFVCNYILNQMSWKNHGKVMDISWYPLVN